jgi:hypothetical protein
MKPLETASFQMLNPVFTRRALIIFVVLLIVPVLLMAR